MCLCRVDLDATSVSRKWHPEYQIQAYKVFRLNHLTGELLPCYAKLGGISQTDPVETGVWLTAKPGRVSMPRSWYPAGFHASTLNHCYHLRDSLNRRRKLPHWYTYVIRVVTLKGILVVGREQDLWGRTHRTWVASQMMVHSRVG